LVAAVGELQQFRQAQIRRADTHQIQIDAEAPGVTVSSANGGTQMDFIERFFHWSPDGGSGTVEAIFVISVAGTLLVAAFRKTLVRLWRARSTRVVA
jgi:hypothetical protein